MTMDAHQGRPVVSCIVSRRPCMPCTGMES
jgi:hypothetical protein